jgi:SAM-dependent methyltransferase
MKVTARPVAADAAAGLGGCRLCMRRVELALVATDRNRECGDDRFRYGRCSSCGTLSLVDVPQDLGRFYPSADDYYGLPTGDRLERLADAEEYRVELVRRRVQSGSLVEIGPGAGVFSYAARRAGFDVTAIEMDGSACDHLRAAVGVRAVQSDAPATALAEFAPVRAIAMWHVIEHLHDPAAVLDAVAAALEPGGVLALATPNPRSLQFRLLGRRWAHLDAPRHLALIPLATLTRHLEAAGLIRVDAMTADAAGRSCTYLGWEFGLRRRPAAGPSKRLVLLATFGLSLALRPLEDTGMRGAAYTAVFVKKG